MGRDDAGRLHRSQHRRAAPPPESAFPPPRKTTEADQIAADVATRRMLQDYSAAAITGDAHIGPLASTEAHPEHQEEWMAFGHEQFEHALEEAGLGRHVTAAKAAKIAGLALGNRWEEFRDELEELVSAKNVCKAAHFILKRYGITIAEKLLMVLKTVEIPAAIMEFQCEAFMQIIAAHQRGRNDNGVYKYAEAWAAVMMFGLYGEERRVPIDLAEHYEPVHLGRRDAFATLGAWGQAHTATVARALREAHGSEDNIRHALLTELCRRAGAHNLKFHEGR